ncbi:TrkA C-terminal domain-containing protein [Vallitalea guaymasensis]|uniref:GntR family transcriptional regulator n=1 Tax=Vallitalea guaymasensis TaxID=1185412 RepID=A0A8J8SBH5_9FIRM|nr:TrkA C-terminal domain-containing protein [Vallitalea guaymasensis]QUH28674.1 GntR family transcriptional regulator [Vallitalea guaymasensis]
MPKKNSTPVYMKVAVDVASRISREEIPRDKKISGRSTLAGEYNVSPETIRKAMRLLSDMNIVEVKHGNGIYVSSVSRAEEFIERYRIRASVNELKEELVELMKKRDDIEDKINKTVNEIVDYTSRFKNSEHVTIYEHHLNYDSRIFDMTLDELDMWNNTGVTVVGIKRDGRIILSPSPEEKLRIKDKLLFVGEPSSTMRLSEYIKSL